MYEGDWLARLARLARRPRSRDEWSVPRAVWGLGLTSLLTDASAEMVLSVLPAYLVMTRGLAPLALGVATGLHEGGSVLAAWTGGWLADRSGKRKGTAGAGYAISAVCRLGWVLSAGHGLATVSALIVGDRMGKAIRTAPRDALISLSTETRRLATAFGIHRALDAAGAALGPVLAWLLLVSSPQGYDAVFFTSLVLAVLGLVALWLLVEEQPGWTSTPEQRAQVWREGLTVFAAAPLRRLLALAAAFRLTAVSDAFLFLLIVQRAQAGPQWIPLLYTGTALSFLALAIPMGRLADRFGRERVFIGGHLALLAVYAVVLGALTAWPWNAFTGVALLGVYYASTDGVLAGLAGGLLPVHVRAMGLAWVTTAMSGARLCSAIVFGLLWTYQNATVAVAAYALALIITIIGAHVSAPGGDGRSGHVGPA